MLDASDKHATRREAASAAPARPGLVASFDLLNDIVALVNAVPEALPHRIPSPGEKGKSHLLLDVMMAILVSPTKAPTPMIWGVRDVMMRASGGEGRLAVAVGGLDRAELHGWGQGEAGGDGSI